MKQYRIRSVIGRGGMSTVYLVDDEVLDVQRALKELSDFHASDEAWRERFRNEARLAASLGDHPSIVPIHDYFVWEELPYIVMPYFRLGTVKALVQTSLTTEQVVGLIRTVLDGVLEAEERGVVHRDLKPDNLLRTDQGSVKITDFGIATTWQLSQAHRTRPGYVMGHELYIAPERLVGEEATVRSDLYSVGVIAYELLRGRPPFTRTGSAQDVAVRKVRENAIPIGLLVPGVDAGVASWIDRLLARDPRKRPSGAAEAMETLEAVADSGLGHDWRRRARLPSETSPRIANKVAPITSRLIGMAELRAVVDVRRHAARVLMSPATITVPAVVGVAAWIRDEPWIYAVAAVAFAALALLRFFDLEVAYRSRGIRKRTIRQFLRRLLEEPVG